MKKALIIMLTLLLLSLGGGIAVSAIIWGSADEIAFTEEIKYGDKSVVEGAIVELRFHTLETGLGWDTEYILGEVPSTRTEVVSNWDYPDYEYLSYTSIGGDLSENEAEFARAVARVTGSKNADVEPISVHESTSGIYAREIRCSYRTKDEVGNIQVGHIDLYVKKIANTLYFTRQYSAYGIDDDEQNEETGAWGLYACDINPESHDPKPETVRKIHTVTGYESVEAFYFNYSENKILVVAKDVTMNTYLSVIDVATETQAQGIFLGYDNVYECVKYNDFMVLITGPSSLVVFSKDESGLYHKELELELQSEYLNGFKLNVHDKAFDWDGERLIIAGMIGGLKEPCGMFVSVFDKTGLLYHADYRNSVDVGEGNCAADVDPITVRWK